MLHSYYRYQKTVIEEGITQKQKTSGLHIVRRTVKSRPHSDQTSSSDDESEPHNDKTALLGQDNPTLLSKLSKHVAFIQPPGRTSANITNCNQNSFSCAVRI